MTFFTKILRGVLGCVLACSLLPFYAYAEEAYSDAGSDETLMEISGGDALSEAEERKGETEVVTQSGIQDDATIIDEGDFGERDALHWAYWDDATLVISGSGSMPNYTETGGQPWNVHMGTIEKVVVEEDITSLGAYSFHDSDLLVTLELAESLRSVGDHAFFDCDRIEDVLLPDSIIEIGTGVFKDCDKLKTCHLPDGLEVLSAYTFDHCVALEQVYMPSKLKCIGDQVFYFCRKLNEMSLPAGLTTIGRGAFWTCTIKGDIAFPKALKTIGSIAFSVFNVYGTIEFEEGISQTCVDSIMNGIESCEYVSYPKSLEVAPKGSKVKNGYIVAEGNQNNISIDGILFSKAAKGILKYDDKRAVLVGMPESRSGSYSVPDGTKEMTEACLSDRITDVYVPATVETISDSFSELRLKNIRVNEDNPRYCSIDGILYNKAATKMIRCPRAHMFTGAYVMPDTVEAFDGAAFYYCVNLTDLVVSRKMTAFSGRLDRCPNLTAIYFPREVTSIKNDCFDFTYLANPPRNGLNVFYEGSESEWNSISISNGKSKPDILSAVKYFDVAEHGICDDGLLYYVDHEGTLTITPDENAKSIPTSMKDYDANGGPWTAHAELVSALRISNKITNIGDNAFKGLSCLCSVTIPYSIGSVGSRSFAGCTSLTDVVCEGGCFEVHPAHADDASFDASRIALHVFEEMVGWRSGSAYDGGSETWNGYRLVVAGSAGLPELSTVSFAWNDAQADVVRVSGVKSLHCGYESLSLIARSSTGEDLVDKVDVKIGIPKRTKPLSYGVPFGNYQYQNNQVNVAYNERTGVIEVGNCAIAGEYVVSVTPRENAAAGATITKTFVVERSPERIYSSAGTYSAGNRLLGRYGASGKSSVTVHIWNQYCEDVTQSCEMFRVTDVLTGSDITANMEEYGIKGFSGSSVIVSQFANPRDYRISFHDPSGTLSSATSATINLYRVPEFLNKPYTLVLSGGANEVLVESGEEWASTPYKVRVLDGYDDPCWPTLDWMIEDSLNRDVTENFSIDEQGYLKVKTAILEDYLVSGGETFSIAALAEGCDYKAPTISAKTRVSNKLSFSLALKPAESPAVIHTATFKVGDNEIAKIAFAEGDTALEEPAVPQKDNYVGTWEEYDLASAKGDIVIEGCYTPIDPDAVSDIEVGGDAVYENGAITVNLAASASSKQVRVQSTQTKPLDVVLVCDQSGSMDETLGKGEKKVDALKRCAKEFVTALYENAEKTGADHRVSLVGFACSDANNRTEPNVGGYRNTGILVTNTGGFKKFGNEAKESYGEALLPVSVNGRINQRLYDGISQIAAKGATAADCGLNLAKGIFAANRNIEADGTMRERVVVFITDGVPTDWGVEADRMKKTGANAILIAKDIKQGQGAHIYSIGVDAEANPAASFSSSSSGVGFDSKGDIVYDFNRFLHAVSSNYQDAEAMNALGDGSKNDGYYMAVNDTANLNKIFSSILYSAVYAVESFDRATLAYSLPEDFVLTLKQEEEMRVALTEEGIVDDDIVVSEANGVTTIVFKNVKVKEEYENGIQRYVARVSFRVSAKNGVDGAVAAGSVNVDKAGDVTECVLSDVVVPQDRCVLVFKVNDAIYEIRDAAMGDAIELPDTDIARWMDLERKDDPRVNSSYAVFETTTLNRTYTLRWVVEGEELTQSYAPGTTIRIPDRVEQWMPADKDLIGWAPSLPTTMPTRNVVCTAVLAPKHEHSYTASEYMVGKCTEGLEIHRTCICGDDIEVETMSPQTHDFDAILGCSGNSSDLVVEELVCKTCGHTIDKHITYSVSKSQLGGRKATVVNMSKYENMMLKNGESDDDIEMRYYIGTSFYDQSATYTVTRIDEDGTWTTYDTRLQNGYLVFDPDHFSVYVISEKDPATNQSVLSGMSYEDALSMLANPDPDEKPSGGPEETTGAPITAPMPNVPDVVDHMPSGDDPHDFGGWDTDMESIDALARTTIASSKGVDLSLRSPKTGQTDLGRSFWPLLQKRNQAA